MQAYVILHGTLGSSQQLSLQGQSILQAGQVDLFELHVDPVTLGPLLRITLGLKPEVGAQSSMASDQQQDYAA